MRPGTGIVDYKGGKEPSSQWWASFRFTGGERGDQRDIRHIVVR